MQPQQLRYDAPMQHPSDCHTSFYTKIPKLAPCLVHPTLETLCIEFGIANDYFSWLYELREVKLSITTTQLRQGNFNDGTLENLIRKCFQLRVFHIYGIAVHDVIKNDSRMAMNHEDTDGQMSPANVLDLLHTRRDTLKEVRIDMNRWDDLTRLNPYYGRNPAKFIYQNLRESRQLVELEIEAVRLDFDPCDMQASLESLTLTRCDRRPATLLSTFVDMINALKQRPCPALKRAHLMGSWSEEVSAFVGGAEAAKEWETIHRVRKAGAHVACCMQTTLTGTRELPAVSLSLILTVTHMSRQNGRTWRDGYERLKLPQTTSSS
jgi:hypothetical protein